MHITRRILILPPWPGGHMAAVSRCAGLRARRRDGGCSPRKRRVGKPGPDPEGGSAGPFRPVCEHRRASWGKRQGGVAVLLWRDYGDTPLCMAPRGLSRPSLGHHNAANGGIVGSRCVLAIRAWPDNHRGPKARGSSVTAGTAKAGETFAHRRFDWPSRALKKVPFFSCKPKAAMIENNRIRSL